MEYHIIGTNVNFLGRAAKEIKLDYTFQFFLHLRYRYNKL